MFYPGFLFIAHTVIMKNTVVYLSLYTPAMGYTSSFFSLEYYIWDMLLV